MIIIIIIITLRRYGGIIFSSSGHHLFGSSSAMMIGASLKGRPYHRSRGRPSNESSNSSTLAYMISLAVAVVGLSYAAVPLYRLYCQASGYGGTVNVTDNGDKIQGMEPIEERELTIRFNADISSGMRWQFIPQQKEIKLVPGETALAFYTAINPTDKPITGIATYNVIPFEAGQYFNKIQCFCFEEQRLNPHEEVSYPPSFDGNV
jgi:cytochrome c oxidase assembly protein subunit 11